MGELVMVGAKISLVTQRGLRFIGIISEVNKEAKNMTMQQVVCKGTEGRPVDRFVPVQEKVYDTVTFQADSISTIEMHVEHPLIDEDFIMREAESAPPPAPRSQSLYAGAAVARGTEINRPVAGAVPRGSGAPPGFARGPPGMHAGGDYGAQRRPASNYEGGRPTHAGSRPAHDGGRTAYDSAPQGAFAGSGDSLRGSREVGHQGGGFGRSAVKEEYDMESANARFEKEKASIAADSMGDVEAEFDESGAMHIRPVLAKSAYVKDSFFDNLTSGPSGMRGEGRVNIETFGAVAVAHSGGGGRGRGGYGGNRGGYWGRGGAPAYRGRGGGPAYGRPAGEDDGGRGSGGFFDQPGGRGRGGQRDGQARGRGGGRGGFHDGGRREGQVQARGFDARNAETFG